MPDNRFAGDNPSLSFDRDHLKGLAPAGRLDIDSTGLLVFTQDGRIAKLLIGEDSTIEKEYHVRVEGQIDDRGLTLLNHGLSLDGVALKPAKVTRQGRDQLRFVLREGKKRQIRRMCELVGLKVTEPESRAHRSRGARRSAAGTMALPARLREVLSLPMRLVLDTNVWIDWLVFDDPSIAPLKAAQQSGASISWPTRSAWRN